MKRPKILLEPADFDALHASSLAWGGIGRSRLFVEHDPEQGPQCVWGHAGLAEGVDDLHCIYGDQGHQQPELIKRLKIAGLTWEYNDWALADAGVGHDERVDFERYCELLNIDVREPTDAETVEAVLNAL
jgi:hypothetical protein